MNVWRGLSNDASYQAANTFDLRVGLGAGSFIERGELLDVLADVATGAVEVAEERLILPTQVSIETESDTILVPGRLIGVDLADGGPHVNSLHTRIGRSLQDNDAGTNVVSLEHNFARFYDLPAQGTASLSGDVEVTYVGQALSPEYFFVVTPEGGLLAQANFAAVFASIETAQKLTGMDGKVNDLILRLSPGADEDALFGVLEDSFASLGGTVTRRLDDPSIKLMIADVEGDQQFNTVLAVALFGGAVFAAFNLTSRIVDSSAPGDRHSPRPRCSDDHGCAQTAALQRAGGLAGCRVRHTDGYRHSRGARRLSRRLPAASRLAHAISVRRVWHRRRRWLSRAVHRDRDTSVGRCQGRACRRH